MHTCTSTAVIEELVHASSQDPRCQYALRQALHGLVRQAQSEQLMEIRLNVARLTGVGEQGLRRRSAKGKQGRCPCDLRQQQFEFEKPN